MLPCYHNYCFSPLGFLFSFGVSLQRVQDFLFGDSGQINEVVPLTPAYGFQKNVPLLRLMLFDFLKQPHQSGAGVGVGEAKLDDILSVFPHFEVIGKLDGHVRGPIVPLVLVAIIQEGGIVAVTTPTKRHNPHSLTVLDILGNVHYEKMSTMNSPPFLLAFRSPRFALAGVGIPGGLGGSSCDPKVEPLVVPMGIDIILQQQVIVLRPCLLKRAVKISALEVTFKF